tara:strand:- start:482 stop:1222 length:741 start_codon:yes stop_codon:yes gene_type:complete
MSSTTEILEYMQQKDYLKVDIQKILEDEGFRGFLNPIKKGGGKKKTPEERVGIIDPEKCDARIWNEGYGAQCNFTKVEGECFCSRHLGKPIWLGLVNEPRPENPVWNGVEHYWKTDTNGNEIESNKGGISQKNDGNIAKKKRGRPKGSKNKNKSKLPELKSMSKDEVLELLEKKIKEKEKEEEKGETVEEDVIYMVDNVPYEIKDNEIMDPNDYSPIGQTDGKGGIIFEDNDAEVKHLENIKTYCK